MMCVFDLFPRVRGLSCACDMHSVSLLTLTSNLSVSPIWDFKFADASILRGIAMVMGYANNLPIKRTSPFLI